MAGQVGTVPLDPLLDMIRKRLVGGQDKGVRFSTSRQKKAIFEKMKF